MDGEEERRGLGNRALPRKRFPPSLFEAIKVRLLDSMSSPRRAGMPGFKLPLNKL